MSVDIRDYIREFDGEFEIDLEKAAKRRRPGIDSLKDGTYTFAVESAVGDVVTDEKKPIVRLVLTAEGVEGEIEHVYWLNSQVSVNILGQDLLALGFDADKWTGKRHFSEELFKVLQSGKLAGRRFKGQKATETVKGKTYHRLYINWPLGGASSAPPSPPPVSRQAAAPPRQPMPAAEEVFDEEESDIPF